MFEYGFSVYLLNINNINKKHFNQPVDTQTRTICWVVGTFVLMLYSSFYFLGLRAMRFVDVYLHIPLTRRLPCQM